MIGRLALLLGLFGVPAVLLWAGHRMRRRSPRWHSAFWGAVIAYVLAGLVATVASMVPPEEWRAENLWRGVFGFWTLLVAPTVGAAIGLALTGASRGGPEAPEPRTAAREPRLRLARPPLARATIRTSHQPRPACPRRALD